MIGPWRGSSPALLHNLFAGTQCILTGCALVIAIWVELPWATVAAFALLAVEVVSASRRQGISEHGIMILWAATLGVPATLLVWGNAAQPMGAFCGVAVWLNGFALWRIGRRHFPSASAAAWRRLAATWGAFGCLACLASGYVHNQQAEFFAGLAVGIALLFLCKRWFHLSACQVQLANTLILFLGGLPLLDLAVRPRLSSASALDPRNKPFSYEYARRNPRGYRAWTYYIAREWGKTERRLYLRSPKPGAVHRLKPNADAVFCRSKISVNSRGFRGGEIAEPKGETYRIVALGESSTFGFTLNADDRPWPELLQDMIRERLKPSRPVEVINAGIPGYQLPWNLKRLQQDILSLKPDLIISYHGINGFPMIYSALTPACIQDPPTYVDRPLRLLARCEHRIRIFRFQARQKANLARPPADVADPLETEYAKVYAQLIQAAQTSGVPLALANFSMAVSERSDPDVVGFYRATWPEVAWHVKANVIHSSIVERLAQQPPNILFVDTHPGLDGVHEHFIDLVHLTQDGRQQLAENIFAGIQPLLKIKLGERAPPWKS